MTDIFLSYAREDRLTAELLAEALESQGWSVWWDREIPIGQRYHQFIEGKLDLARSVLVIWSAHSVDSDWVLAEVEEGMARECLLPVSIDDTRPPLVYRQLETADLKGWRGEASAPVFRKLISNLSSFLGPPPDPTAAPRVHEPREEIGLTLFGLSFTRGALLTLVGILLVIAVAVWFDFGGSLSDKEQPEAASVTTPVASNPEDSVPQDFAQQRSENLASPEAPGVPLVVTLDFTEQCWVEAQVDGADQVSRLFVAGESLRLEADERVVLQTLGNASGVDVQVNGEPFDISPEPSGSARNVVINLPSISK